MRGATTWRAAVAVTVWLGTIACGSPPALEVPPFGRVGLWKPSGPPARVVLLVSGDRGFDGSMAVRARALAARGALVVGIDLPSYRTGLDAGAGDAWPAADLEVLSQTVQSRLGLARYHRPVVAGIGAGAALAYAALAQSNPRTFAGAVSVGFCPSLALPRPPGAMHALAVRPAGPPGQWALAPAARLFAPWVVLPEPGGCDVGAFVARVPHAKLLAGATLPEAVRRLAALGFATPAATEVGGLPLVEVPATRPETDMLAVVLSGDGGWAGIDRDIGGGLAAAGIPVVGWNSLDYYWTPRTPDEAAGDLARVLRHYLSAWRKRRAILAGYSRGADVLPFLATRLPDDLRHRVALVALLAPERAVSFTFHLSDWLDSRPRPDALPLAPELARLHGVPVLCIYGGDDADSLCPTLAAGVAELVTLPGGHHFGGDYDVVVRRIVDAALAVPAARSRAGP
jgi:type IV secretory pathway VirJ component